MQAPPVARGVLHDRRQEGRQLARIGGHLTHLGQPQERAAAVLHTVDRVFCAEPFAACQPGKLGALALDQAAQVVERIVQAAPRISRDFGVHRGSRCQLWTILQL
jgi:hypothetical protein